MLLMILARMSNDEQRMQLLQTLRRKLTKYQLGWMDVRKIVSLFENKGQMRFEILQFLLEYLKNLNENMEIEDYIDLSNQCTKENEQLKFRLFEQIYRELNVRNRNDLEKISNLFQIGNIKQKVEAMIRINYDEEQEKELADQHFSSRQMTTHPQQTTANTILPSASSFVQQLSVAPLKRKYSLDHSCHQILIPSFIIEEDELIQQRDILPSISINSSNSSLSSASDENIPIRTRSFMIAMKKTFEHLKETSS